MLSGHILSSGIRVPGQNITLQGRQMGINPTQAHEAGDNKRYPQIPRSRRDHQNLGSCSIELLVARVATRGNQRVVTLLSMSAL